MNNSQSTARDATVTSLQDTISVLTEALRKEQATHERTQVAYVAARAKLENICQKWCNEIDDLPRCTSCEEMAVIELSPCEHYQCRRLHGTTRCAVAGCNSPIRCPVLIDYTDVLEGINDALTDAHQLCVETKRHAEAIEEDLKRKGAIP